MGKKQEIVHLKMILGQLKMNLIKKERKVWLMKLLLKSYKKN